MMAARGCFRDLMHLSRRNLDRKIPRRSKTSPQRGSGHHEIHRLLERRCDGRGDALPVEPLPEDVPITCAHHAVAFLHVKGEDRVVGAGAPEERAVIRNDELPEVAPETLALRFAFDCELAEVRAERRFSDEGRSAIILLDVRPSDVAIEEAPRQSPPEARLQELGETRRIDLGETVLDENRRASLDERAGAANREELAQEQER